MRGKRIVEMLRAMDLLCRPQGVSIKELCDDLGKADRKAAYRMLDLIQEIGVPVYDDRPEGEQAKRWYVEEGYAESFRNLTLPKFEPSLSEYVALRLALAQATACRGTEIEQRLDAMLARLGALLPDKLEERCRRLGDLFLATNQSAKDYRGKEEIIDALVDAMIRGRSLAVRYDSFSKGKMTEFTIDPLYFFEHHDGLYLFMRSTDHGDIRILAVERILNLKDTGKRFEYPEDFDPRAKLEESFSLYINDPVEAVVRVHASQARYVRERRFFQSQEITEEPDGSILVHLKTSGRWDVRTWILSLGRYAEVLEPEAFRVEIATELREAVGRY